MCASARCGAAPQACEYPPGASPQDTVLLRRSLPQRLSVSISVRSLVKPPFPFVDIAKLSTFWGVPMAFRVACSKLF